jgi:segregation and condensation protein B
MDSTEESQPIAPEPAPEAEIPAEQPVPEPPVESAVDDELPPDNLTGEVTAEELLPDEPEAEAFTMEEAKLKAVLEAIIYVTDEPLSLDQICIAVEQPRDRVIDVLEQLTADYERADRGLSIREIAGGFKMATKPEHHEEVRRFVKNLNPPLKLSLPALETLAVIAYKQPITAPEIMEIRGVQGAGVLKTLLDRKLIGTAGRKAVIGKPILYKTTREFLLRFGLKDVGELPSMEEFEKMAALELEEPEAVAEQGSSADGGPVAEPEAVAETSADGEPELELSADRESMEDTSNLHEAV